MYPAERASPATWLALSLLAVFFREFTGGNGPPSLCQLVVAVLIRNLRRSGLTTWPAGVFSPLVNLQEMYVLAVKHGAAFLLEVHHWEKRKLCALCRPRKWNRVYVRRNEPCYTMRFARLSANFFGCWVILNCGSS